MPSPTSPPPASRRASSRTAGSTSSAWLPSPARASARAARAISASLMRARPRPTSTRRCVASTPGCSSTPSATCLSWTRLNHPRSRSPGPTTMSTIIHLITPALAHVTCDANLLVRNVQALAEPHTYRSVFVHRRHPPLPLREPGDRQPRLRHHLHRHGPPAPQGHLAPLLRHPGRQPLRAPHHRHRVPALGPARASTSRPPSPSRMRPRAPRRRPAQLPGHGARMAAGGPPRRPRPLELHAPCPSRSRPS